MYAQQRRGIMGYLRQNDENDGFYSKIISKGPFPLKYTISLNL
jgi:hypothetical protein